MTKPFNAKKTRDLLYAWHGGQSSPFYAAASSGLVDDLEEFKQEIQVCRIHARTTCKEDVPLFDTLEASLEKVLVPLQVHGRTYAAFPWSVYLTQAA